MVREQIPRGLVLASTNHTGGKSYGLVDQRDVPGDDRHLCLRLFQVIWQEKVPLLTNVQSCCYLCTSNGVYYFRLKITPMMEFANVLFFLNLARRRHCSLTARFCPAVINPFSCRVSLYFTLLLIMINSMLNWFFL